jgi:hypothetical protein
MHLIISSYIRVHGSPPTLLALGTGGLSPGVKLPEREADHSPPSSAEVKNVWSYTPHPYTYSWLDS